MSTIAQRLRTLYDNLVLLISTINQDLPAKADKVYNATAGDFAGLDSYGNLTDSGHKHSDYAEATHYHTKSDITNFGGPYIETSAKGAASGVAPLGEDSKVPSSYLPSYVDDVVELLSITTEPSTCTKGDKYYNSTSKKIFTATATNTWGTTGKDPESGKIYVNLGDNKTYRWSGTALVEISASLVIGTTAGTAYDGGSGATLAGKVTTIEGAYVKNASKASNTLTITKQDNSTVTFAKGDLGLTSSDVSLGNVTNNKQVKGLASGTTSGHIVTWGSDGYTVADSGYTIATSVPSGAIFTDNNTTYDFSSDASKSNGNVKLHLTGSDTSDDAVKITGSGVISVTSDSSGDITVTSNTTTATVATAASSATTVVTGVSGDGTATVIKSDGLTTSSITPAVAGSVAAIKSDGLSTATVSLSHTYSSESLTIAFTNNTVVTGVATGGTFTPAAVDTAVTVATGVGSSGTTTVLTGVTASSTASITGVDGTTTVLAQS